MDIRIGIANSPRELNFETDATVAEVEAAISAGLEPGATHFRFADNKGKLYVVPTASLSYLELGTEKPRSVGFVA